MQSLSRIISRNHPSSFSNLSKCLTNPKLFSTAGDGGGPGWFDSATPSWSTGLTKDQIAGEPVGRQVSPPSATPGTTFPGFETSRRTDDSFRKQWARFEREAKLQNEILLGSKESEKEVKRVLKQIEEPGARGSYLKDSEKAEMYKKFKDNPEVYTVDKLAQDYGIMRQRVEAILYLKEDEEEEVKKRGEPLDDAIEQLLDAFPDFFISYDREFHVASLPRKPDFKVMPEGWDGTIRDPDEVHYEISKKEEDMLYEEFVRKFNFTKMKFKNQVKVHKYSRRRPSKGWDFVVTKCGPRGKRGAGGGWKFVSEADGSTRPLNDIEKVYVKRETPLCRRKIFP